MQGRARRRSRTCARGCSDKAAVARGAACALAATSLNSPSSIYTLGVVCGRRQCARRRCPRRRHGARSCRKAAMDLAEDLPPISDAAVTSKQRCRPHAALAFRAGRQWVITRPGSCGRGRGGPSSHGNVTTGLPCTVSHLLAPAMSCTYVMADGRCCRQRRYRATTRAPRCLWHEVCVDERTNR